MRIIKSVFIFIANMILLLFAFPGYVRSYNTNKNLNIKKYFNSHEIVK